MKQEFRVIIAGSREFDDYELLKEECDHLLSKKRKTHRIIIVSGTANGADKLGEKYAKARGYIVEKYPADWNKFKKAAGYIRNESMAKIGNALIAFRINMSRGTTHMINLAHKYKLQVAVIDL